MENLSKEELLFKLANRIKELRLQKGVSQQDVFNDTGIHFGRIEQGKRDISCSTILYFVAILKLAYRIFLILTNNDKTPFI